MTKQEFLAFSLPYGLKVYDCIGNSIEAVDYSKGCPKCVCEAIGQVKNENKCVNVFQAAYDKQLKPILHPLSDLTKEIDHKGEKFYPIDKILENSCFDLSKMSRREIDSYADPFRMPELMSLDDALMLCELHFDIAGLIDKGEAIDVNTLTENPYK